MQDELDQCRRFSQAGERCRSPGHRVHRFSCSSGWIERVAQSDDLLTGSSRLLRPDWFGCDQLVLTVTITAHSFPFTCGRLFDHSSDG
jgi:hypothetical protein